MALQKFPLPYIFEIDKSKAYATKSVKFYSQKEQVQIQSLNPVRTWKINVRGTADEADVLESFFDDCVGDAYPFLFTDENGDEQQVRFADATLNIKKYRDFDKGSATHGFVVGFDADINLKEVL